MSSFEIVYLVVTLGLSTFMWNAYVLYYTYSSGAFYSQVILERPLKRWVFKMLIMLTSIQGVGMVVLTIVQVVRNFYLANSVGITVDAWLVWVVAAQNVIFYALSVLPAVILFAYTWAIVALEEEREDKLNDQARRYLKLETRHERKLRRESSDP